MNDNENVVTSSVEDNAADYIEQIQALRANTVSKDDYEKLKNENRKLISSLAKGEAAATPEPEKADLNTLRKKVFDNPSQSNLEYIRNALNLRNAVLEQEGYDCFAPHGQKTVATTEDIESANRVAATLQECIDYAQGDSRLFTNELQRRTVDVMIPRR